MTTTRAYMMTVLVVDHDEIESGGPGSIARELESGARGSLHVLRTEAFEIGEWHDDHPLNLNTSDEGRAAWMRAHGVPCAPDAAERARLTWWAQWMRDAEIKAKRRAEVIGSLTPGQREALGLE